MAETPSSNVANAIAAASGQKPAQAAEHQTSEQKPVQPEAEKAFAMKERQLHAQRKALLAEKEALQKKIAEYETGYIPRTRLKEDPYAALEEAGVDYSLLTEQLMSQPQDPASRAMMAKIKELQAKIDGVSKSAQEQQQNQYNEALKQIDNEAKLLIDSDERFETIKAKNMHEAVTELIKETFDSEGRLMDVEEAAQQIEDYLVEEGYSFAQLKKVQAKLAPKPVEPEQTQQTQKPAITTLTNRVEQEQPKQRLSDKERRARAIAAMRGEKL